MSARATSIHWTKSSASRSTFMRPCAACIVKIAPPTCGMGNRPRRPRWRIFTMTRATRRPQASRLPGEVSCLLSQQTNQGRGAAFAQRRRIFRTPLGHLADRATQKNVDDPPSIRLGALEVVDLHRIPVMRQELRMHDDVAARELVHNRVYDKALS